MKNSKNSLKKQHIILIILGVLALPIAVYILVYAAIITSGTIEPIKQETPAEIKPQVKKEPKVTRNDTEAEWKKIFVDECNIDGDIKQYCECTYDNFRSFYTDVEFIEALDAFNGNEIVPDEFYDAVSNCLHLAQ